MKVQVENLGPLRVAEFEIGDLTIICGANNTGKTYATYALYGFLAFWHEAFSIPVEGHITHELLANGSVEIDLEPYLNNPAKIIDKW